MKKARSLQLQLLRLQYALFCYGKTFRTRKMYSPAKETTDSLKDKKRCIDEMLLGYTINGAIQLGIEDKKGSITAGKDADFLVFENDLLTAEHEGFSYNMPCGVYFSVKKMS